MASILSAVLLATVVCATVSAQGRHNMASILSAVLLATVVCATASAQGANPPEWEALKAVYQSNFKFSLALYKEISGKDGNLFFSPASIHTILALTSQGARGSTAQEMMKGLHLPADQQKLKDGFRYFINWLQSNSRLTTKLANKIYTDSGIKPTPDFIRIATEDFHSGSELVDFRHKHEQARVNINTWVAKNTENQIKDLLPTGSVDEHTAMVLVNALYFKGAWKNMFEKEVTKNEPFHVTGDVTKNVPMMHMYAKGHFGYTYSQKLNADVLSIPYESNNVSMIIILPKVKNGLRDVEAKMAGLTDRDLRSARVSYPNVHLKLPKFTMEESFDLEGTLKQMGMGTMFGNGADFSGLTSGPIKVSKIVHKAFINVDEKGTKAAAATAVNVVPMSAVMKQTTPEEVIFEADHPFLFWLVNNNRDAAGTIERSILYMGRYSHP